MKANELTKILFKNPNAAAQFVEATVRWGLVRSRMKETMSLIEDGDLGQLETVDRIRSAIKLRASKMFSQSWVSKAWDALPANIRRDPGDVSAATQAETIKNWADDASDKAIRKLGEEALIWNNETVTVEFFERAINAAKSVGKISLPSESGTGFLVGEGIFITNNHVIDTPDAARSVVVIMDLEENRVPPAKMQQEYDLDPDRFFYTNEKLDFTLVASKQKSVLGTEISDYGYLPLIREDGKILKGHNTNIVQHMGGGNKVAAFRRGVLVELSNQQNVSDFYFYTSDTGKGSSGSPVFNDSWQVVALHHHSVPQLDVNGNVLDKNGRQISKEAAEADPSLIAWEANEGTRISRLVADLEQAQFASADMKVLRDKLIALWSGQ